MHRIDHVTSARIFRIAEDGTEWIGVMATGTSPSLGWRNPILTPWLYTERPADNVQDFDFSAEAPARTAPGGRASIAADHLIEKSGIDYWGKGSDLAGVRIHSSQNEIEAHLAGAEPLDPAMLPTHVQTAGVPWSWSGGREPEAQAKAASGATPPPAAGASLASLIGTRLRVIEGGDRFDRSPSPDRTTVRIDPVTRVIESAWIG